MKSVMSIVAVGMVLSGCATVTRGTTNDVSFNSAPFGATVTTSIGHTCQTPCQIEVPRDRSFTAVFNLEGFEPQTVPVETRIAGAGAAGMAGNLILGGVVGAAVDVATGATLEHYPNPVYVDFNGQAAPGDTAPADAPVTLTDEAAVPTS